MRGVTIIFLRKKCQLWLLRKTCAYGVSTTSVYRWVFAYRKSVGLPTGEAPKPQPTSKPLGVPAASADAPEYEAMGKEELIRELMRRDIEVARLKKATR